VSTPETPPKMEPDLGKRGWGRGNGRRRFAPLDVERGNHGFDAPRLRGVVFDVDGTLW
jgi:hypothetical protein